MNLYQLKYIIAVDHHRHFAKAAEACHITQPTLSAMVHKLEEELNITLFDRSRTPVVPTEEGQAIIGQAKNVLAEAGRIQELASEWNHEIKGELKLGIIPTTAPFLWPLCLENILQNYPEMKLTIRELTTEQIIQELIAGKLDAGILATPLHHSLLREKPLYQEAFTVYSKEQLKTYDNGKIDIKALNPDKLWLLAEGHCWRNQVINFCQLRKKDNNLSNLNYEAGSVDALKKLTDAAGGMTILPELATHQFNKTEKQCLYEFNAPVPARQISMVTYRNIFKQRLIEAVENTITSKLKPLTDYGSDNHIVEI